MNAGPSPEACLILAACRETEPRDLRELSGLVTRAESWPRFVDLCRRHRVTGLILDNIDPRMLPDGARADLHEQMLQEAAGRACLRNALREILEAMDREGCAVIPLKGPAVGDCVYADPRLRPYVDLDLLVHERDYGRAAAILGVLGYRGDGTASLPPRRFPLQTYWESHFRSADGLVPVELHVDPLKVGLRLRDPAGWWEQSARGHVAGTSARLLGMEHLLLLLSVHLQRHALALLSWLKDVDLVVRRSQPAVDWDRLLELARLEETAGLLWYPLRSAKRLLGTPVPDDVLCALAPALPLRWLAAACLPARLLVDRPPAARSRRVVEVLNACLMGRRLERLRSVSAQRRAGRVQGAKPAGVPRTEPQ